MKVLSEIQSKNIGVTRGFKGLHVQTAVKTCGRKGFPHITGGKLAQDHIQDEPTHTLQYHRQRSIGHGRGRVCGGYGGTIIAGLEIEDTIKLVSHLLENIQRNPLRGTPWEERCMCPRKHKLARRMCLRKPSVQTLHEDGTRSTALLAHGNWHSA